MSHTPTPWDRHQMMLLNPMGKRMGMMESMADAAHIVKCVNAHEQLAEALGKCAAKPNAMQEIMRKHNLKIDDLADPMQKLAFTFYTELCESAHEAQAILDAMKEEP